MRIVTPGQNAKRAVFGALNLRTGAWFYQLSAYKRSADFIAFFAPLLAAYPVGCIYILVDNASIHASKLTRQWLAQHPRIELLYLPTYSGHQLNPVEKVWWALKGDISANRCFKLLHHLDTAIHRFFADFSPEDTLAMVNSPIVRDAQLASSQM